MTSTEQHAVSNAMSQALTRFYAEHPEIDGIALDTVRKFAAERFDKACERISVSDPRFTTEAPAFAYRLLLDESLMLAKSLR